MPGGGIPGGGPPMPPIPGGGIPGGGMPYMPGGGMPGGGPPPIPGAIGAALTSPGPGVDCFGAISRRILFSCRPHNPR